MTNSDVDPADREYQLTQILGAYYEAGEEGHAPSQAELIQRYPELAAELVEFFCEEARFDRLTEPVRKRESLPWLEMMGPGMGASGETGIAVKEERNALTATWLAVDSSEAHASEPNVYFGEYEILERIGNGGMGMVFKARQRTPNRLVALKMILAGRLATPNDVKRFHNEAEAAAELDHPHIVPIYEVGERDGYNFFSMKLIEGGGLDVKKAEYGSDPRRAASVIAMVARAVHHAHQRGVLHRDLKPSNILTDTDGQPIIVDFGLAKRTRSTVDLTQDDVNPGTPRYMAPEQLAPNRGQVTTATDVYGLGGILYVLLTGTPAVQGESAAEVLEAVSNRIPVPPSKLNRRVPRDLETICLKCLEKEPSKRYSSAGELADDLNHWLAGEPIKARPVGRAVRTWLWCRRNPTKALLGSALTTTLVLISAAAAWLRIDAARRNSERAQTVFVQLNFAEQALEKGWWVRANEALGRAEGLLASASETVRDRVGPRLAVLQMMFQLEDIRMNHVEAKEDGLGLVRAASLYAAAFRDHGIDVDAGDPIDIAKRLQGPDVLRAALVAALDDWAHNTIDASRRGRLLAIADAAVREPGSLSSQVRRALAAADKKALLRLAAEARVAEQTPATLVSLATGLRERGALEEAAGLLTAAQKEQPGDFWLNLELATTIRLWRPAEPRDALPFLTAALALSNGNPGTYAYIGNAQLKAGKLTDAVLSYRQAIARKPELALAHINLGYALNALGHLKDAEAALLTATKLDPRSHLAYYNLGLNLQRQHDDGRAAEAYRRAITIKPDYTEALNNYGNALTSIGRFAEALEAFDTALALRPGYARAHFNRAYLLDQMGRFDEAVDGYRSAIQYKSDYAEAFYQIAWDLLYQKGEFAEAAAELERGVKFMPSDDPTRKNWDFLLSECRRLLNIESRLDAYLKTGAKRASALGACELAQLSAWPHRQLFGEAARLYEKAFVLEPARAGDMRMGYRYHAAECAAQAGSGKGRDRVRLDEPGQAHWREKALEWLRADLAERSKQIKSGKPEVVKDARGKLSYWQTDHAFAGVRDPESLHRLPGPEGQEWSHFWKGVAELTAGATTPLPKAATQ
jgi:eukaryotic-like serine/threonine-protein kinase